MKTTNAIKKIEKAGYRVAHVSGGRQKLYRAIIGEKQDQVLEFHSSTYGDAEETTSTIGVRSINDHSDPMTDYCAFIFYNNITQALAHNA